MLFKEKISAYCGSHMKNTYTICVQMLSSWMSEQVCEGLIRNFAKTHNIFLLTIFLFRLLLLSLSNTIPVHAVIKSPFH
jgi:hypothetical protein